MRKTPHWSRRLAAGGMSTLAAGGLGLTGLAALAHAAGATSSFSINPISGADRFATAADIAEATFTSGADTVIIASGLDTNLSDSLAASYLAAQEPNTHATGGKGAPILLTNPNALPSETTAALSALRPNKIVIVGGTGAVSTAVQAALSTSTVTVSRVSGADRFATADAIDSQSGMTANNGTAIVADGLDANLVDALGASPLAYDGSPLFLVNGPTGSLSTADLAIMSSDTITKAVIVGGTAAVGTQVAAQLTANHITSTTQAGANRSATSLALANYEIANFGFSTTHFDIASGDQGHLVDALAGGPLGGVGKLPTLITLSIDNAGSAATFASSNSATEVSANLFGGPAAVDSNAQNQIIASAKGSGGVATSLPQLTAATVGATGLLGTTVTYTFSQTVTAVTAADFKLYPADGTAMTGSSATIQSGGTTVNVGFTALNMTSGGSDSNDIANYTLATVASGAATGASGMNPDGSAAIGTTSSGGLMPGKTNAPNLTGVTISTNNGSQTEVDYTFDAPPTLVGTASNFALVNTGGGPDLTGSGSTMVSSDQVAVEFTGVLSAPNFSRGYVTAGAVKASGGAMNPLESATLSGAGSALSTLNSVALTPSVNTATYTFSTAVSGALTAGDFNVFDVNGISTPANTAVLQSSTTVLATFTGDTFANVVGANVGTQTGTNINAASFGVVGSGSGQTSGIVAAPQLTGVSFPTLANSATYTFSQPIATGTPTATDFDLYLANGTEEKGMTCADGTSTTVVCTKYTPPVAGAAPSGSEVLGTVDAGAVMGSTAPDNHANPEGAANA